MKCEECGYEHDHSKQNWVFNGDDSFEIKSNVFDAQILSEIAEYALSSRAAIDAIYIDTWLIGCLSCETCSLRNIRNGGERSEVEKEYRDRGLVIHYFF
ncbi:hypothetical protein ACX93W_14595 [Paenibacillus sp. CAU 1782]